STYSLELTPELRSRKIHPTFHGSLLQPHEANDKSIFPSQEAQRFYDFGMPAKQDWLVNEIVKHKWTGKRTVRFWVKWTAGDHTWEPLANVNELQALDEYLQSQGATNWQDLP
ncbi:hypothetical protein C8J57DRAFT_979321, partial [Mycena rebaudengoi]